MRTSNGRSMPLSGLDGSNPLGFLAAVGALRVITLSNRESDWRLTWTMRAGTWVPSISGRKMLSKQSLIELLENALCLKSAPEFNFAKNLNVSPACFKQVAGQAVCNASLQDRRYADFVASFGCELVTSGDRKSIQDTALRTMSGAGHQHFLGTIKKLIKETKAHHLCRTLFHTWDYSDEKLGLRWDPEEDRRYALRWDNPSGDKIKSMWGANRLAVEALPLLPTAPVGQQRLQTTGFAPDAKPAEFSWPIWSIDLGSEIVGSLLALSEIQKPQPNRSRLHDMGVVEVYRSQRITVGKYRNFTRAQPA